MLFRSSFIAGIILKPCADYVTSLGIDDAVGAVTVHGTIGIYGVLMMGVMASGYPGLDAYAPEGAVTISFVGQLVGSVVMILSGLVPGYIFSWVLNKAGMLRVPDAVQVKGLDVVKVPAQAYPEGMTSPVSEDA